MSHIQLARITGFGDHKATAYGVRIMRAIEEFVGRNPALRPLLRQMQQRGEVTHPAHMLCDPRTLSVPTAFAALTM